MGLVKMRPRARSWPNRGALGTAPGGRGLTQVGTVERAEKMEASATGGEPRRGSGMHLVSPRVHEEPCRPSLARSEPPSAHGSGGAAFRRCVVRLRRWIGNHERGEYADDHRGRRR